MTTSRPPAVAGMFYAADPDELRRDVNALLDGVAVPPGERPRVLIAPHAGYIYSGAVAAEAYARLRAWRDSISRVVIFGPAHRVPLYGVGASSKDAFDTPLGRIAIDTDEITRLLELSQVEVNARAHAPEHSLEVHLPFLQCVLSDFKIVPLIVGEAAPTEVADLTQRWWDDDATVIVISTDLSHFLDYDIARQVDSVTDKWIRGFEYESIGPEHACGCRPLNGILQFARLRGAHIERLKLCNSGDTAGSRDRVVGYASYALR